MGKDARMKATRRLLKSQSGDDVVISSRHTSGHTPDRAQEHWVQELIAAHTRPWVELALSSAEELGRGALIVEFRRPGTLDAIEPDLRQDPRDPDGLTLIYLPSDGLKKVLGGGAPQGWQSALDRVEQYDPGREIVLVVNAHRTVYSATLEPIAPTASQSPN